jgi:hypothetical protein
MSSGPWLGDVALATTMDKQKALPLRDGMTAVPGGFF